MPQAERRRTIQLTLLLAGAGIAAMPGHAQTDTRDGAGYLAPVSVTATRNPIKSFEYPGMVTVIGREAIDAAQASSVDDLLKSVPGVEFTGGPRRTGETPSIRGLSGPDVVLLFDGTRQNYGSAHDGRFFIDPSLLKQVEVLRGSASSLYGSGGTGGVIEFHTVEAADLLASGERFGAMASGGYQHVNEERLGALSAYGRPLPGLDLVASITRRASSAIELGNGQTLTNTEDDIVSGLAKASYGFADHHRLEGSYMAFRNDAVESNNGQGAGGTDAVEKDITTATTRVAYSFDDPDNRWLDLDLVAYSVATRNDETRLDGNGAGPRGEVLRRDVDTYGLRLDNRSRLDLGRSIAATFTYGGEIYRDEQDGAAGAGERDGVPDAEADTVGLFAQAELAMAKPFGVIPGDVLIIPGIRFDDYETSSAIGVDNSDSQVSPRLGLSYLPNDWLLLFGNYGEAFRAPTFDELYLTGNHFTIPLGATTVINRFVSNPNLRPQTTRTVEYGVGLTFDDAFAPNDLLQVKVSRYHTDGEDFIDTQVTQPALFTACNPFIPGNCDGTTTNINVPNASLRGTEVEASYENHRLLLSAGYATISGRNDDTGARLGVLTPDQYTLHAALKVPEYDVIAGWRAIVADDFDEVNTAAEERAAYDVHDVYVSWQPRQAPIRGIRVDLGVDNLFDEDYSRTFTGAAEPGRNYKAAVRYQLNW